MKRSSFIIIITTLLVSGCQKEPTPANTSKPPVSISEYCMATPNELLRKTDFEYNDKMQALSQKSYFSGKPEYFQTFMYKDDRLEKQFDTSFNPDGSYNMTTYIEFEYNNLQLSKKKYTRISYSSSVPTDTTLSEALYYYSGNNLIKEIVEWGGSYEYEYTNNVLMKKKEFTAGEHLYSVSAYSYTGNLLTEEVNTSALSGNIRYKRAYEYLNMKISKVYDKDGNLIETYTYTNNNLAELKKFYFGIDPGYDVCYGNYIIKYAY